VEIRPKVPLKGGLLYKKCRSCQAKAPPGPAFIETEIPVSFGSCPAAPPDLDPEQAAVDLVGQLRASIALVRAAPAIARRPSLGAKEP